MEVIRYIQFAFAFDKEKLQQEVSSLNHAWIAHLNTAHYTGEWSALPLRSPGGSGTNIVPDAASTGDFEDTPLMRLCPYIKEATQRLPGVKKAIRLMKLRPGAQIREHRDIGLCYEQGEARIHIPVTTNPSVTFFIDGENVVLKEGECWYFNFDLPHRLGNMGTTDRVHLVIDCIVDGAMKEMIEKEQHTKIRKTAKAEKYSEREKLLIANELRRLNTDVSLKLAREIE